MCAWVECEMESGVGMEDGAGLTMHVLVELTTSCIFTKYETTTLLFPSFCTATT